MRTLAALSWDPQIRGFLIVLTAFIILVGSVYLLLMTNLGTRLAFLVAVAGLSGWMMLLGLLWTLTPSGTGPKGRDPHWRVERVIAGELGPTAPEGAGRLPQRVEAVAGRRPGEGRRSDRSRRLLHQGCRGQVVRPRRDQRLRRHRRVPEGWRRAPPLRDRAQGQVRVHQDQGQQGHHHRPRSEPDGRAGAPQQKP